VLVGQSDSDSRGACTYKLTSTESFQYMTLEGRQLIPVDLITLCETAGIN
jgi:hypothetical protein